MYRFCIATLVLCAASLLALQLFVSFTPVYAAAPSVTITSPIAGSWYKTDFSVGYDALDAGACKLFTNDAGAGWLERNAGLVSCGLGQDELINVPAWCFTQGLNQCGVRVIGNPPPPPIGCADGTIDQNFGTLPSGEKVYGCNPSVGDDSFDNAVQECAAGFRVGDIILDLGLAAKLDATPPGAGVSGRWIHMNGDPGNIIGQGHPAPGKNRFCWVTQTPCTDPSLLGNSEPPIHGGCIPGGWCELWYNNVKILSNYGIVHSRAGPGHPGTVCVGTPPPLPSAQDERFFSIDLTAPTVTSFTATDGIAMVDSTSDPLVTAGGSVTLNWTATDNAGGSGIKQFEVWRSPDGLAGWIKVSPNLSPGTTSYTDSPGGGDWWYGLHVLDNTDNCINEAGGHCGGVASDGSDPRASKGPLVVVFDNVPPIVSFDTPPTPPGGSVRSANFSVQYDTTDNIAVFSCKLFTSANGGAIWTDRGTISCGLNQTASIDIDSNWCPLAGANQCGVEIRATDTVGNTGSANLFYTINQRPTVVTMLDTSTPIANPLALDATASDDGLLNPLTYAWTKISGPGTANFSPNASVFKPTVTFTNIGTYVLRLTVNDGFFTPSDDITIDVLHEPPVVSAGADPLPINFGLPSVSVTVTGTASDDGFIAPLVTTWSRLSGPAPVTFGNASLLSTTATFTASGVYELKLEAFDGQFTSSDLITITVVNNPPIVDAGPASLETKFGFPITLNAIVSDDSLPNLPATLTYAWSTLDGPGIVTFANPSSPNTGITLSQAGAYILRLDVFDGEFVRFDTIEILYGAPARYGLIPCGVIIDDPGTPYNETDPCALRHLFLLIKNLIDFTLWKLTPIIVVIMVVATGAIFYFSWGSANTLATVRRIWRYIGIGVLILMFSWLFLNFFLGILGFDINIFGRWTEIAI